MRHPESELVKHLEAEYRDETEMEIAKAIKGLAKKHKGKFEEGGARGAFLSASVNYRDAMIMLLRAERKKPKKEVDAEKSDD